MAALEPGMLFVLYTAAFLFCWSFSRSHFVQATFIGPSGATFVNPDEDPRKK
jgi:hypothetical protein